MSTLEEIIDACFAASPNVRYVAAYLDSELARRSRADVELLGTSESDRYEEIIVNPTLLKMLGQRGNIDCGGLQEVTIRYGMFIAYIYPVPDGHVNVSFELDTRLDAEIPAMRAVIERAIARCKNRAAA